MGVLPGLLQRPDLVLPSLLAPAALGAGPRLQQRPHHIHVPLLYRREERISPVFGLDLGAVWGLVGLVGL